MLNVVEVLYGLLLFTSSVTGVFTVCWCDWPGVGAVLGRVVAGHSSVKQKLKVHIL